MYSFNPLPVIDTINSHGGFWFLVAIALLINLIYFGIAYDYNKWKQFIIVFVLSATFLNYAGYKSWNTGKIITPKNERVIGTLKGFQAEGEAYTERQGKQTVRRENHYLYVVYSIEGNGLVTFKALSGITYPEKAILYKN